jgi:hypothetical protein
MALFPLGILSAAAGEAGGAGDYQLIESVILGTAQASIVFSSLGTYSSTYKHLQIRGAARISLAQAYGSISVTLNGNTSGYARHELSGNGSSVSSSASTSAARMFDLMQVAGANNDANAFGGFVLDILDPYATKNKTLRSLSGRATSSNPAINLSSGLWDNTASLTSIELIGENGNLVSGTRISLYGIKG